MPHVQSRFVSMRSRVRSAACSSVHVFCVARSSGFNRLHAFMLCLVLCGLQLSFFIGRGMLKELTMEVVVGGLYLGINWRIRWAYSSRNYVNNFPFDY